MIASRYWTVEVPLLVACMVLVHRTTKASDFSSIDGGFYGKWSAWTRCSSDCGTGITTRTRECMATNDVYIRSSDTESDVGRCSGSDKESKLCNTQSCPPGRLDIRAKQCSRFNTRVYSGRRYQWQPYINPSGKCELTCKAKGHNFYTRLSRTVRDGTPCHEQGLAVCLSGKCVTPGCENILGSETVEDQCGVCDGDSSTCRKYSSVFESKGLKKGFNDIFVIPMGAKNINITEFGSSVNFIALRDANGTYYLNSPIKLNPPGIYKGLGATFNYFRRQDPCVGSCITARGPIEEPLFVRLKYYEGSNGIEYSYTLDIEDDAPSNILQSSIFPVRKLTNRPSSQTIRQRGTNVYGEEFKIPVLPATHINRIENGQPMSTSNNDASTNEKVIDRQLERDSSFMPQSRKSSSFTPLSSKNGNTLYIQNDLSLGDENMPPGYHRIFQSVDNKYRSRYHNNGIAQNHHGITLSRPPVEPRVPAALPLRGVSGYTELNGRRPNTLTFLKNRKTTNTLHSVTQSENGSPDTSEISRRIHPSRNNFRTQSALHSGNRRRWRTNRYSGHSYDSRYKNSGRAFVSANRPAYQTALSKLRQENTDSTFQNVELTTVSSRVLFFWKLTGFTECSQSCGKGNKTSMVSCINETTGEDVAHDNCDINSKPRAMHVPCNKEPCPPRWMMDEWGTCDTTCGDGTRRRKITCLQVVSSNRNVSLPLTRCSHLPKPHETEKCHVGRCYKWNPGNWTECSSTCGKGHRTRVVPCTSDSGTLSDDSVCPAVRPTSQEVCDMGSCVGGWFAEPWSTKCPVGCGSTLSTRKVVCLGRGGNLLPDSDCRPIGNRPSSIRSCKRNVMCGASWFTGEYTECNTTCGSGFQSREAVCVKKASNRDQFVQVKDENCRQETKPITSLPCTLPPCKPQWFTTEWSQCSVSCGSGVSKREVKCLDTLLRPSLECDLYSKPPTVQFCITQDCQTHSPNSDPKCMDRFSRCSAVSKSGLCMHPYYRKACCSSCAHAK